MVCGVLAIVAFLALGMTACPAGAQTETPQAAAPADPLATAQQQYDQSQFDQAVTTLRQALAQGQVTGGDVVRAKELLARSLARSNNRIEAKEMFKSILRQDPGYRADPVRIPPDEMEVFNLALTEFRAEQVESGRRVPASFGFFFGLGSGASKDFAEIPRAGGGADHFDSKTEFGVSVRFPLKPRLSLDFEISRFRATNSDSFAVPTRLDYETTAIPLVVSLYWTAMPHDKWRANLFLGGGPMGATRGAIKFNRPGTGYFVADEKVGTYVHAGIEGEWLVNPHFSLNGRVLGRSAKAKGLFKDSEQTLYATNVKLADREVDFSGFGAFVGVRAYIGY
jgi:hypothetical protein